MGVKFMRLAGDIGDVVPILLIAAVLVAIGGVLVVADDRVRMAALIVAITAAIVGVLFILALLMSFGEIGGQSVAGAEPWQTRVHLLLAAVASLAAAALANEGRERA